MQQILIKESLETTMKIVCLSYSILSNPNSKIVSTGLDAPSSVCMMAMVGPHVQTICAINYINL